MPTDTVLNDSDAFAQTLADERQTIVQFIELLKLEQASLNNGGSDELLELAASKDKLAVKLGGLAQQRSNFLAAQGLSTDRRGVEAYCAAHPEAQHVASNWSAILALATDARELQQTNGKLIEIRLQYNAKALEALQGGRKPLDLYGPDGQSKTAGNQRINHTV